MTLFTVVQAQILRTDSDTEESARDVDSRIDHTRPLYDGYNDMHGSAAPEQLVAA